jgi:hypothetical protein
MTRIYKQVLQDLDRGELPIELNFNLAQIQLDYFNNSIDWSKLYYLAPSCHNRRYFEKTYEHLLGLPGFDQIINKMIETAKTPLEQLEHKVVAAKKQQFQEKLILLAESYNYKLESYCIDGQIYTAESE